jgi:hypothetical protein
MQEDNESRTKKLMKKVSKIKMSKSQKGEISTTNFTELSSNVRLDTSESDEESVSEVIKCTKRGVGGREKFFVKISVL